MGRSLPVLLALALSGVLQSSGPQAPRTPHVIRGALDGHDSHLGGAVLGEYRYRILGKLRLAFFWAGRDDVGGARMTWRSDGATSALTFLVGSNPQRAPHNLNEWSYVREEVRSDRADVFTLRSLGGDEARSAPGGVPGEGPVFGVSCASFREQDVHSAQTTVRGRGATYWMFDRLLDQIAVSPSWQERRIARPAGAAAGFLTALQDLIRLGRSDARALESVQPVAYVYNNVVYDLSVRNSRALGRTIVGARTFDRLVRTDFAIRNRSTREVSRVGVTYVPDQAGPPLPVQIFYQPSFWLRVELRLDDAADVPLDPAADGAILTRIRGICAGAGR
jgi:hypothetical protein